MKPTPIIGLNRAPLGYPAERAALGEGEGVNITLLQFVISGTKRCRGTGQAAIEGSQHELSIPCLLFFLNRSPVMSRSGQRPQLHVSISASESRA